MVRIGATDGQRREPPLNKKELYDWYLGHAKGTPVEKEVFLRLRLGGEELLSSGADTSASRYRRRAL